MRLPAGAEAHGVVDELVEQLRDELARADDRRRCDVAAIGDLALGINVAIGSAARRNDGRKIERLRGRLANRLLELRRFAHRGENAVEPLRSVAQALQILIGFRRFDLVLEIVERRRDDGERRAQLVRELARERAQVLRVLAQALEQLGEAARERSELVAARPRPAFRCGSRRAARAPSARRPRAGARATTTTSHSRASPSPTTSVASNVSVMSRTSARFVSVRIGSLACSSTTAPSTPRRACDRHGRRDDRLALGTAAVPRRRLASGQRLPQRLVGDAALRPLGRVRRVLALEQPTEQVAGEARAVVGRRARRDAARGGEHPAVFVEHSEPSARAAELAEQALELGYLPNEPTRACPSSRPRSHAARRRTSSRCGRRR